MAFLILSFSLYFSSSPSGALYRAQISHQIFHINLFCAAILPGSYIVCCYCYCYSFIYTFWWHYEQQAGTHEEYTDKWGIKGGICDSLIGGY